MLRVLKFEGEKAQSKFDKVWEGFLFGTRAAQERSRQNGPDRELQRKRSKITAKLKKGSEESKRVIAGGITYRDVFPGVHVKLEQQELDLLVKTMEETDWLPEHLDDAFEAIDWVAAADKEE